MALTTASAALTLVANDYRTIGLVGATTRTLDKGYAYSYTVGVGANQVNTVYGLSRTFGGSPDSVDLTGSLTDAFGATITNARIKVWGISNTGSASLTITTSGSNGWTACMNGVVTLPAGATCFFAASDATGWAVTAGTGDLVAVAGTSGQTYELFFLGGAT